MGLNDPENDSLLKELEQLSAGTTTDTTEVEDWIKQQNELMSKPLPQISASAGDKDPVKK